jgi:hypothetical protein
MECALGRNAFNFYRSMERSVTAAHGLLRELAGSSR